MERMETARVSGATSSMDQDLRRRNIGQQDAASEQIVYRVPADENKIRKVCLDEHFFEPDLIKVL